MVSSQSGMGAIPFASGSGVSFRVWVPNVDGVSVAGEFNSWSPTAHPLDSENNGFWSTEVTVASVGQQYKFVIHEGTNSVYKNDPYARDVTSSVGNSIIVDLNFNWTSTNFSMPAWNELIIYEMHVGTFNDDIDPGLGTFRSIKAKLPDLQALGINAIHVMPAAEFPGDLSWGYNPSHPFAIESVFGTPSDFKDFVQTVHNFGIAVIVDVVYNHFGPRDLDMWRFTSWNQNNKGGIYFYNDDRDRTPWGNTRPDYGRGEVRQYIRDNALMWLEECRCDGLRFDATAFIRNIFGNNNDPSNDIAEGWSLIQWINNEINARQPWKITIAEDIRNNEWITKDTGAGGAGFDTQWSQEFVRPVRDTLITPNDRDRNMFAIRDVIYHRYGTDAFERVIYTESHDEVARSLNPQERPDHYRLPEEIWRGNADSWFARKRSTLGAVLLFTTPGIPMIFQGQEFLEWGSWADNTPLDWSKKDRFKGIWDLYQSLIRLRRNWFNNTRGLRGQNVNVFHINNNDKLIAFHRWENGGRGDDVIVVLNFSDRNYDSYTIGFPSPGTWYVRFNSDWQGFSPDFGNFPGYNTTAGRAIWGDTDGLTFAGNVGIGAYSGLIFSQ
ncbi:alpha amylase C-terminal domain-containing protein [Nostoc sphaeroides CHAB 2801]|uniref:alpha-amylase family glycosyl hydrolase n=1 Tax=Nostoc sphaeroides TaxID=446679 RepID=UPI001C703BB0|nr:alpha-amylase family glycosyl hydrolase [Nostoc sphaeroides]MCC5630849.1 alpha amylase C-terminal domain-containing protein [Nostoc sphaeroides CHAB 2801]